MVLILVSHEQMTLGDLVSFNVYLGMIIWPMFAIGELINVMQRGNASLDRVQETLDYEEDVKDASQSSYSSINLVRIGFDQVKFQYPQSSYSKLKRY